MTIYLDAAERAWPVRGLQPSDTRGFGWRLIPNLDFAIRPWTCCRPAVDSYGVDLVYPDADRVGLDGGCLCLQHTAGFWGYGQDRSAQKLADKDFAAASGPRVGSPPRNGVLGITMPIREAPNSGWPSQAHWRLLGQQTGPVSPHAAE